MAAALAGGATLGVGLAVFVTSSSAQQKNPVPVDAPRPAAQQLPINNVVLFSSGVGYFQREGEVQGNARIDLSFPVTDINDLIKSMVLQDAGGGHVSAVSYDSQAPLEKTLRSFAIDLTTNPTFGQILNQARGEKIEAVLQQTQASQPGTLTGVIMGVEKKKEAVAKDVVESEMLNLWCAEGMRCIRLGDIQRLRFLNPTMDSEVKKALETLALSHDTQKKSVSLAFTGEGRRTVKVGYVVENPIWKTSYRLVLDKKGKPFLQGWAVVENTQDEDWNNVRMALVSGRPISFQMDLYQPLYVNRPVVEPELFASLRPPTYQGAMERDGQAQFGFNGGPGKPQAPMANRGLQAGEGGRKDAKGDAASLATRLVQKREEEAINLRSGVAPATSSGELGDFFQYAIETPVTLPRQKSALLPIVNEEVEGTKVSIYNQNVHAKFPLLGLRFKNSTKLHLMQGPITVFEGSSYAGDARILDLQPKEDRLISYAIDLGTEVEPVNNNGQDNIIKIKVNKGFVEATHKVQQSKTYRVKNRSEHDRTLLIEHPYRPEFNLMTPAKATERARDVYRFEVKVPSGDKAELAIVEERDIVQSVQLSNTDDNTMRFFLSHNVSSPKVKAAIEQAVALKGKLSATTQEIGQHTRTLNDIRQDQQRLRENLKTVPPDSDAYKRYVKKFDQQETEIEKLQDLIKKLQEREFTERKAFENYLGALSVE
jgi:hypothetical protein